MLIPCVSKVVADAFESALLRTAMQELKGQKKAKQELLERHQSHLEALAQHEDLLSKSLDSAKDTAKSKPLFDAMRRTRRRNKAVDVDEHYSKIV